MIKTAQATLEARKYKKIAKDLAMALEMAVGHLDYCGYGDSWERECADHHKLPAKLDKALDRAKEAGLL